jgi:hypothetical protein
MKGSNFTSTLKKAGMVTMLVCVFATSIAAQKAEQKKYVFKENTVKSLIEGINSANDGVRKSSIYYAGLYSVDGTVDALIEQLENEKIPSNRVLIVLSLYMIGDPDGLDAIYKSALKDTDRKVRLISSAVYEQYKSNSMVAFSSTSK